MITRTCLTLGLLLAAVAAHGEPNLVPAAASPGDASDPDLVLVVEGLAGIAPKKPMKSGTWMGP